MEDNPRAFQALFVTFFIALIISIGATYNAMVLKKQYQVFTDPDTVPAPTDFLSKIPGYIEHLWIH